jgi:hypothetical protein
MEYLSTFMRNKKLFLVIYTENKPCANYGKKNGGEEKIRSSITFYVYQIHYKGNVFVECRILFEYLCYFTIY